MQQIVHLLSMEKDFDLDGNLFWWWKPQHLLELMTQIRMQNVMGKEENGTDLRLQLIRGRLLFPFHLD